MNIPIRTFTRLTRSVTATAGEMDRGRPHRQAPGDLARPIGEARSSGYSTRLVAALVAPVFLGACAHIPESTVAETEFGTLSCAQLAEQTEQASATKALADQAKSDAWQVVVPFIVAARYGHAASAASDAERRLALLSEQASRLDCAARPPPSGAPGLRPAAGMEHSMALAGARNEQVLPILDLPLQASTGAER